MTRKLGEEKTPLIITESGNIKMNTNIKINLIAKG